MAREDFGGEEYGGLVDEYEFTITDAYFATVPTYNEKAEDGGEMLFLHWLGQSDVPSQPIMTADSYHPSFKCGRPKHQDWQTLDGGKTAIHPDPEVSKFDSRSAMGRLNARLLKITESLEGKPDDPLADFDPRHADGFVGMKFRMKREETTYNFGGREVKANLDLPEEYLGKATGTPAAAPAAAAAAPAAANGTKEVLVAMAKASADYATFQRQALQVAGVTDNQELLAQVLDESGGIWAQRG